MSQTRKSRQIVRLLESGTEGCGEKVEAAIKVNKIASKRVVFVGSVLQRKHAIEDLFTVGDYLLLHNEVRQEAQGRGAAGSPGSSL